MTEEQSFESVKHRLDEIVEAVSDEDMPLDAALDLYEEAVKLGMQASAILEENIGIGKDGIIEDVEEIDEADASAGDTQAFSDVAEPNPDSGTPEKS